MDENHPTCDGCGTPLITYTDRKDNEEQYCPKCEARPPLTRPHPEQSGERAFQEGLSRLVHEGAPKEPCPECGALNWYPVGLWWSCGGKDGHPCGHLLGVNEPLGEKPPSVYHWIYHEDGMPEQADCHSNQPKMEWENDVGGWVHRCGGVFSPVMCYRCSCGAWLQVGPWSSAPGQGGPEPAALQSQEGTGPHVVPGQAASPKGHVQGPQQRDSRPAPIRPEGCPNDPFGAKCFPDDCHCWDPEDGCTALPAPGKPGSLDAAFTRGVEFVIEKGQPAPQPVPLPDRNTWCPRGHGAGTRGVDGKWHCPECHDIWEGPRVIGGQSAPQPVPECDVASWCERKKAGRFCATCPLRMLHGGGR